MISGSLTLIVSDPLIMKMKISYQVNFLNIGLINQVGEKAKKKHM